MIYQEKLLSYQSAGGILAMDARKLSNKVTADQAVNVVRQAVSMKRY